MLIQKFPPLSPRPDLPPYSGLGERGEKSHENFKAKFNSSFQNIKFYTLKYFPSFRFLRHTLHVRGRREVTGFSTDNVIFAIKSVGSTHLPLNIQVIRIFRELTDVCNRALIMTYKPSLSSHYSEEHKRHFVPDKWTFVSARNIMSESEREGGELVIMSWGMSVCTSTLMQYMRCLKCFNIKCNRSKSAIPVPPDCYYVGWHSTEQRPTLWPWVKSVDFCAEQITQARQKSICPAIKRPLHCSPTNKEAYCDGERERKRDRPWSN